MPNAVHDGIFSFRDGRFDLSARTHIMGILNVTPDSFSDGGKFLDPEAALKQAERMVLDGADMIDVGGESTKPYSEPVQECVEIARAVPVVSAIAKRFETVISIDTCKASVARAALDAGANIVNDVSALRADPELARVATEYEAGLILMHMKGIPRTMQENPHYEDVVSEVRAFLGNAMERALAAGARLESILLDPGIGFGKKLEHNLILLKNLPELRKLGRPIMVGPSRKSFIGQLLDAPVGQRLSGTLAAVVASVLAGAQVVRVHDVKEAKEAVVIADAIMKAKT